MKAWRGGKLKRDDLMTGEVWLGREAVELGLVDALGAMPEVLKEKFGPKVRLEPIKQRKGFLSRFPFMGASVEGAVASLEERVLFSRFGL